MNTLEITILRWMALCSLHGRKHDWENRQAQEEIFDYLAARDPDFSYWAFRQVFHRKLNS
jgi:hypothetical protein